MTQNQIAFQKVKEERRHNILSEAEQIRHNVRTEELDFMARQLQAATNTINEEHYRRQDAISAYNADINRVNAETNRQVAETGRYSAEQTAQHYQRADAINSYSAQQQAEHYLRSDQINAYSAEQQALHYERSDAINQYAAEQQAAHYLRSDATNLYAAQQQAAHYLRSDQIAGLQLQEQMRHQRVSEGIAQQSNLIESAKAQEISRHNYETEAISASYNNAMSTIGFTNARSTQRSNEIEVMTVPSVIELNEQRAQTQNSERFVNWTQGTRNIVSSLTDIASTVKQFVDMKGSSMSSAKPVSIANNVKNSGRSYYNQFGEWIGE